MLDISLNNFLNCSFYIFEFVSRLNISYSKISISSVKIFKSTIKLLIAIALVYFIFYEYTNLLFDAGDNYKAKPILVNEFTII
jgi:hypothetical protein